MLRQCRARTATLAERAGDHQGIELNPHSAVRAGTRAGEPPGSVDDRVKLWIDDQLVIQQWTSLASTAPSGTIAFAIAIDIAVTTQYFVCL